MQLLSHKDRLYTSDSIAEEGLRDAERRLARIEDLLAEAGPQPPHAEPSGRNLLTRVVDKVFAAARTYIPPLHWIWVWIVAIVLFLYARLVALTARFVISDEGTPLNSTTPCVLALWHGSAPSLLVAIAARKFRSRTAIMISRDPRGDCLALLCRLFRMHVVRGDSSSGGWSALASLAREMKFGTTAIITADGGGPARVAKVGAVALSSATGALLVAIGTDCHPAITERHKWDVARNPVPFSRIAIVRGQSCACPVLNDLDSIDRYRDWLERALEEATAAAERTLCENSPRSLGKISQ